MNIFATTKKRTKKKVGIEKFKAKCHRSKTSKTKKKKKKKEDLK